jgi:hypothetical protein
MASSFELSLQDRQRRPQVLTRIVLAGWGFVRQAPARGKQAVASAASATAS